MGTRQAGEAETATAIADDRWRLGSSGGDERRGRRRDGRVWRSCCNSAGAWARVRQASGPRWKSGKATPPLMTHRRTRHAAPLALSLTRSPSVSLLFGCLFLFPRVIVGPMGCWALWTGGSTFG